MIIPEDDYSVKNRQVVRKKRKKRGLNPRKVTKTFLLLFITYLVFNFSHGFYQGHQLKKEIKVLEKELHEVTAQNNELQNELKYIQTPEAIEKIAREKLGLIKSGEIVIRRAKEAAN